MTPIFHAAVTFVRPLLVTRSISGFVAVRWDLTTAPPFVGGNMAMKLFNNRRTVAMRNVNLLASHELAHAKT